MFFLSGAQIFDELMEIKNFLYGSGLQEAAKLYSHVKRILSYSE